MKRGPQDKTKVSERADLMADWDEGKKRWDCPLIALSSVVRFERGGSAMFAV